MIPDTMFRALMIQDVKNEIHSMMIHRALTEVGNSTRQNIIIPVYRKD